jgi:site-specific DNA-methyltransferase (adenine-specific)
MTWKLYEGDCLKVIPTFQNNSFDLIILDPPYNINKDEWDKIGTHDEYLKFIEDVLLECQRVLKDNGSLYLWHNQFPVLANFQWLIKEKSDLIFKQFIVWNKRFGGASNKGFLDGFIEPDGLRNYQKMVEYCLFYTFQDETGLKLIERDGELYKDLREYCLKLRGFIQYSRQKMIEILGNGRSQHFLEPLGPQWQLCTLETYNDLINFCNIDKMDGFREYEDLRCEYEDLRYTFNNQKTHHSVWDYETESGNHPTQKPIPLSENIIKHSSNVNDNVLIPFAGSGSEMIASTNLNRNVVGIEQNPQYCQMIRERLSEHASQSRLILPAK